MNRPSESPLGQAGCLLIGLAFGLGLAMQASAQWLPDRRYAEGPGIRLGELELHPGVAIRAGYDNNVFKSDGDAQPIRDAAVLAITPHLNLTTEGAQRAKEGEDQAAPMPRYLAFRGGIAATYLHYFLENAPRNVAIDTDLKLNVAQGRPVELVVSAGYLRSVTPFTENAGARNAYVFNVIDPALRLKFNSRSQVLTASIGYAPKYTHFESSTFNYLNSLQHGIEASGAWRFLPSTALVYDAGLTLQNYMNFDKVDERLLLLSNNESFQSRVGVNGALTNHLSLRVLAGYAVGFYNRDALDEFEDAIGEAVMTYGFGPHSWSLGYQRTVASSALGAWIQTDRGFTKLGLLIAQRFSLGLEAGAGRANYGRLVRAVAVADDTSDGDPDGITGLGLGGDRTRDDIRIDGAVRAEYRATNWLAVMLDFTAQSVITDFDYELSRDSQRVIPDPADFTALQVFGGVRAHY